MLSSAEDISILAIYICVTIIQQKLGKHLLFRIMFLLTLLFVHFKRNRWMNVWIKLFQLEQEQASHPSAPTAHVPPSALLRAFYRWLGTPGSLPHPSQIWSPNHISQPAMTTWTFLEQALRSTERRTPPSHLLITMIGSLPTATCCESASSSTAGDPLLSTGYRGRPWAHTDN